MRLYEGDLARFNYDGGSNPGSQRTVLVLKKTGPRNKNISCWDFDKDELRTFTQDKITNVRLLEEDEYFIIDTNNLPETMRDTTSIVNAYEDMGYKCYVYENSIVAAKIESQSPKLVGNNRHHSIDINLGNNHWFNLHILWSGEVQIHTGAGIKLNATTQDLIDMLNS